MSLIRILIIDDNKAIHNDYQKIFQNKEDNLEIDKLGMELFGDTTPAQAEITYELVSAYQGKDGLEMVKESLANETPYHLAFVDMRMPPGWDGLKTVEEISKIDSQIQLVICTAYSDYSHSDITQRIGSTDRLLIIKKPFDQVEIIQLAHTLAEKWKLSKIANHKMEDLEAMVTERTKELEEANKNLKFEMKQREQIQGQLVNASKLASLGEMAAGIAHEINNPLTIINGYAQILEKMIEDNKLDEELVKTIVPSIKKTINRISKIISGLRSFSRDGSNDNKQLHSLKSIMDETIEFGGLKFKKSNIPLDVIIPDEEITILCKGTQISQVLVNLLCNAFDAIHESKAPWVKISCHDKGDLVEIDIEDSGPGINKEIIDKIMNPFFTTKGIGKGTGLGLSISHGIINDHGGNILIDENSKNTCFRIMLPKQIEEQKFAS